MNHTISVLTELLVELPIGTNLAMMHVFWALLSGQLLPSRGALFPALKAIGLEDDAVRRAWTAVNSGVWQTAILIELWRKHVEGLPEWKRHEYEGYKPVVADITAFWRPTLKNCPSKHYHPAAGRALPAVIFGVVGKVGEINGQRIALPQAFERVHPKDPSEAQLWRDILKNIDKTLCADEIVVVDAGVKVRNLQEAGLKRYVVRLANNFTARRNTLPEYCGLGRKPVYGELIRPLPRTYKKKRLPQLRLTRPKVGTKMSVSSEQRFGATWFYLTVRLMRTTKPLMSMPSMIPILIRPGCWQLLSLLNQSASEIFTKTVGRSSKFH